MTIGFMDIVPQLIVNSIIAGSVYALMAIGFNLIFGATKFFNLTHGIFSVVGAYTVFVAGRWFGLPWYVSIPLGVVVAGIAGVVLDQTLFLTLRRRRATNMVLLVASLGAFTSLQALLAIAFSNQFQQLAPPSASPSLFHIGSAVFTQTQLFLFISMLGVWAAIFLLLRYTRFGKAVRAVSDDGEVAQMVGIDTNQIIRNLFCIGAAIAGLAGIFVGYDSGISPTMGFGLLLKGIIAAIIGGMGSLSGGVVGGLFLGFSENFGNWKIAGEWKDAIAFVVLLLFLWFRPKGIFRR